MIFIKTKAFVAFFAYVCITYYACFAGHLKVRSISVPLKWDELNN